ncbi:MAG: PD40 domain-containing protein [Actinobacteria bacterium]|nr:PD40 domain-containing protein [Actinomycetota bacterium]
MHSSEIHQRPVARRGIVALIGALALVSLAVSATVTPTGASAADSAAAAQPSMRGAAAAPEAPGTIVFIKNYNVWIARGDGSGQRAVTSGGSFANPWGSPTQSDAGTIVAAQGAYIYQMNQWGQTVRRMDPPPLKNSAGQMMDGPLVGTAVSPDGRRIAYTYTKETCPIGASCFTRSVTGYTDTAALTPPSAYGSTFFDHPSWVTGTRTLQNGGYLSQMNLHDLGRPEAAYWFDDRDVYGEVAATDLGNAEVTRDGRMLAAVRGYGDEQQIIWYRVVGDVRTGKPGLPEPMCWTQKGEGITNPTWSPDGSALAIEQPEGIEIARGITTCNNITMAIRGGSEPSWSNARLSTTRPAPRFLALKKKPTISGTARVGKTLRVKTGAWSPAPSMIKVRWTRDGKKIAGATKSRYKLKRADRGHRFAVTVTVKRSCYATTVKETASKRVR